MIRSVPLRARLAKDQATVFAQFAELIDLNGKDVLEIGGCIPESLISRVEAGRWWACDPRIPASRGDLLISLGGYAESIPLESKSIDAIFSCNAMQHVQSVPAVFGEAARLLKPGGVFYANFGPVWSAPDGAHLENVAFDGKVLNFWDGPLFPAWSHLLADDQEEFADLLRQRYPRDFARTLSEFVFGSHWINRTFADEYRECAETRAFELAFFGGCDEFDYTFDPPEISHSVTERARPERILREIRKRRHDRIVDYKTRDIEFLLVRR